MTPFVSDNVLHPGSAIAEAVTERASLPIADWHHIHDAALDLHRSPSISVALERLAGFTEQFHLGKRVRAVLSDENEGNEPLYPQRKHDPSDSDQSSDYQVAFDVKTPNSGSIRILIDLPVDKSIHDQVKLELMLEHFHVAAQHLPFSSKSMTGKKIPAESNY